MPEKKLEKVWSFAKEHLETPPTVGQFGPLGCRINSTSTFVIFCIRVDVSRVTSGYGGDMTPLSQVRLTPKNGLGSAGRFMAPIGQSHH